MLARARCVFVNALSPQVKPYITRCCGCLYEILFGMLFATRCTRPVLLERSMLVPEMTHRHYPYVSILGIYHAEVLMLL